MSENQKKERGQPAHHVPLRVAGGGGWRKIILFEPFSKNVPCINRECPIRLSPASSLDTWLFASSVLLFSLYYYASAQTVLVSRGRLFLDDSYPYIFLATQRIICIVTVTRRYTGRSLSFSTPAFAPFRVASPARKHRPTAVLISLPSSNIRLVKVGFCASNSSEVFLSLPSRGCLHFGARPAPVSSSPR